MPVTVRLATGEGMARILIVDDDPDIRQLAAIVLDAAGHTVVTARTARPRSARSPSIRPTLSCSIA